MYHSARFCCPGTKTQRVAGKTVQTDADVDKLKPTRKCMVWKKKEIEAKTALPYKGAHFPRGLSTLRRLIDIVRNQP